MISSTLALVFLTTIIFGAFMPMAIKYFKSLDPVDENKDKIKEESHNDEVDKMYDNVNFNYEFSHPNFDKL